MAYTIVGMFPTTEDADKASNKLDSAGFEKEDYKVSHYATTGNYDKSSSNYHYKEDEKTSSFWNWLFGDDEHEKNKYSYDISGRVVYNNSFLNNSLQFYETIKLNNVSAGLYIANISKGGSSTTHKIVIK